MMLATGTWDLCHVCSPKCLEEWVQGGWSLFSGHSLIPSLQKYLLKPSAFTWMYGQEWNKGSTLMELAGSNVFLSWGNQP